MSTEPSTVQELHGATSQPENSSTVADGLPAVQGMPELSGELLKKLPRLQKRKRKLLSRLRRALASKNVKAIEAARRAVEGSAAVRIYAAIEANKRLPVDERLTLTELSVLATACTWNHPLPEPVHVWAEPKRKGGFRSICSFGPMNRTMQFAVRDQLSAYCKPKPFQYDAKGHKGVPEAVRAIEAAILAGNVWVATLDIVKFFQSFVEEELLKLLPLPRKVIANVVVGGRLECEGKDSSTVSLSELLDQARRGAPQGSALSPLIGAMIVSQLEWVGEVLLFNWVDNFLLLGKSEQAVAEAADALVAKVAAVPGGHFQLKADQICHVGEGFEFLGHYLELSDEQLTVEPASPDSFFGPLHELDMLALPYIVGDERHEPGAKFKALSYCGKMLSFTESWGVAFSACDPDEIEEFLFCPLFDLNHYRKLLGATWEEIGKHKDPRAKWKVYS